MVNQIDIFTLSLEELSGVVDLYPWFAAARMEFCRRCCQLGLLTETQLSDTSLYIGNRRLLCELVRAGKDKDFGDKDAERLLNTYIEEKPAEQKKVIVVGSDYFGQEEYNSVRNEEENIFARFATKAKEDGYKEEDSNSFMDFCTETLAKLYLEQDCKDQAISIYSKLSLRYPEKNAYFAALIEEIKIKEL